MTQQPKRCSGVTPGKQERHLNISQKLKQAVHQACLDAPDGLATPEHLIAAINHPAIRELPKPHALNHRPSFFCCFGQQPSGQWRKGVKWRMSRM
jgi:hypothetical protein